MAEAIKVSVCYAAPGQEWLQTLELPLGSTIEQAIVRSGVLDAIAGLDLATHPVGIYAKKKPLDTVLRAHDRVEIYRPLLADPKESRRKRADKKEGKQASKD